MINGETKLATFTCIIAVELVYCM